MHLVRAAAATAHLAAYLAKIQQLGKARLPAALVRPEHDAQPLQPPPPLVRQRAGPPLPQLRLKPAVQTRVAALDPGRPRHAAVAVVGVECTQLAELVGPGILECVAAKLQGCQSAPPVTGQATHLPRVPLPRRPSPQPCTQTLAGIGVMHCRSPHSGARSVHLMAP